MSKLIQLLTNKYLLVFIFAGIWIIFLDTYNLVAQYKVSTQIEQLEADIAYYGQAIQEVDYERRILFQDAEELERYVREKYYFKRSNEDVFILTE
ncbi:MAG: septum formation initiator family protein [Bacteroidota bacterium]